MAVLLPQVLNHGVASDMDTGAVSTMAQGGVTCPLLSRAVWLSPLLSRAVWLSPLLSRAVWLSPFLSRAVWLTPLLSRALWLTPLLSLLFG